MSDCSSRDFSRKPFFSPLPSAWKYCLILSNACSNIAHCFGDRFFSNSCEIETQALYSTFPHGSQSHANKINFGSSRFLTISLSLSLHSILLTVSIRTRLRWELDCNSIFTFCCHSDRIADMNTKHHIVTLFTETDDEKILTINSFVTIQNIRILSDREPSINQ